MIDIEGNNKFIKLILLLVTILSLTYRNILNILDTYPKARGILIGKLMSQMVRTLYTNKERRSLIIEVNTLPFYK